MKFVCDKCHTRYSISDEKVKGKVLKIRCKTCGNIIVVREQGAESAVAVGAENRVAAPRTEVEMPRAASGGGGGGASAPVPPSRANVEWFVAIKGKQHGPMSQSQVANLFKASKIHARSYCWHEDLSGWLRMKDLPDFAAVIAQGAGPPVMAQPPPPPPEDDAGAEVVDLQAHRQQRQAAEAQRAPVPEPGAITSDPFAAVGGVPGAGSPLADGAPRESTRVFIMNAGLHNRSKKHKTYAIVATSVFGSLIALMALDYAGIVRIPFLGDAALALADYAGVEGAADKKEKRRLLAQWEDGDLDPSEACILLGNCPKEVVKGKRRRRATKASGEEFGDDMFQTGGPGESGDLRRGDTGPGGIITDPNASNLQASDSIRKRFAGDNPGKTRIKVKPGANKIDVVSGSGPDPKSLSRVVNKGMGGIKSCIEKMAKQGSTVKGKKKLLIIIGNNGRVKKARLLDGPAAAAPIGECIARVARKWKFPPFVGDTFELVVPLILTTN